MSLEEKRIEGGKKEVKRLEADGPKDLQIQQKENQQNQSFFFFFPGFSDWLTASAAKKTHFCFLSLLFGNIWMLFGTQSAKFYFKPIFNISVIPPYKYYHKPPLIIFQHKFR